MEEILSSISSSEEKLKALFKKHLEIMSKLTETFEKLSKLNKSRMDYTAAQGILNNLDNLLSQLDQKVFESWKKSFSNFVCAIDNKGQTCSEGSRTSEELSSSSWGGGTEGQEGAKAKKTLEEVKEKLSEEVKKLNLILNQNMYLRMDLSERKIDLNKFISFLGININFLDWLSRDLLKKSNNVQEDTKNQTEQLNKLKKFLVVLSKEWENLKNQVIVFTNYKGLVNTAICKNTESTDSSKCVSPQQSQ
ncbi:hypothetical protein [Mycoplasma suis]|nr:hypothetical protein [Mycoplasma suis]